MKTFEEKVNEIMFVSKVDKTKAIFMAMNETKNNQQNKKQNNLNNDSIDFLKNIFGFK